MYLIKKISFNNGFYQSSKIVNHTNKTISVALHVLDDVIFNFVKEECGRQSAENTHIIDIESLAQVTEPITDCIVLYRISSDPHTIYVYQKKSATADGWFGYTTLVHEFKHICNYELEEYTGISMNEVESIEANRNIELVPFGSIGIRIPKMMTVAPMCHLISDLKNSDRFKRIRDIIDSL
jgi:hypothetical protein